MGYHSKITTINKTISLTYKVCTWVFIKEMSSKHFLVNYVRKAYAHLIFINF